MDNTDKVQLALWLSSVEDVILIFDPFGHLDANI